MLSPERCRGPDHDSGRYALLIHASGNGGQYDRSLAPQPTLLLTGTIGSGKTVVTTEIGVLLEERGIAVALIDLDWLNWVHLGPRFDGSDGLLVRNLAAVWPNFVDVGAEAFVLTRAVARPSTVDAVRAALPKADLTIVRLVASRATIERRLRQRDFGSTLVEHLRESQEITNALDEAGLEDSVVSNEDRSIREVADEVLRHWTTLGVDDTG